MLKFYQIDGRIAIGNIHFHALITKKMSRKISRLNFRQNTDDFLTGKRGWRGPGRGSPGGSGGPSKRSPGGGGNFKVQTVALEERASEEETATGAEGSGAERIGSGQKHGPTPKQNWPAKVQGPLAVRDRAPICQLHTQNGYTLLGTAHFLPQNLPIYYLAVDISSSRPPTLLDKGRRKVSSFFAFNLVPLFTSINNLLLLYRNIVQNFG